MSRPPKIQGAHEATLVQIVESDPAATLEEIGGELFRRTGASAHEQTLVSTLRRKGIERFPNREAVVVETVERGPGRYGYTDAHRRLAPEQTYPSCLTDAEWARVRDLFENQGGRGLPPRIDRRIVVDACCYVVRTGVLVADVAQAFSALAERLSDLPPLERSGQIRADA